MLGIFKGSCNSLQPLSRPFLHRWSAPRAKNCNGAALFADGAPPQKGPLRRRTPPAPPGRVTAITITIGLPHYGDRNQRWMFPLQYDTLFVTLAIYFTPAFFHRKGTSRDSQSDAAVNSNRQLTPLNFAWTRSTFESVNFQIQIWLTEDSFFTGPSTSKVRWLTRK